MKHLRYLALLVAGAVAGAAVSGTALAYTADGKIEAFVEAGKVLVQLFIELLKEL